MSKKQTGFVGTRSMVGSVLHERMLEEGDFGQINPTFFSTSQMGQAGPMIDGKPTVLKDAYDIPTLSSMDVIVACQGSAYTEKVHGLLRSGGWDGFWIDAASYLRNEPSSVLVLDPVNSEIIEQAIENGTKDLIGANCTVSTMLMGLAGLFKAGLVKSADISTYQAVSGAGSKHVLELLAQAHSLGNVLAEDISDPAKTILEIDKAVSRHLHSPDLPTGQFGQPIIGNILPWIDSEVENGQSREERKAQVETNAILGLKAEGIVIDSTCVRVGSLRSHAQSVSLELSRDVPLEELEEMIKSAHKWVNFVPNKKEDTLARLTPIATSGSLQIAVGRLRKLNKGPNYVGVFVVGDQLLWGAAEPLRRALNIAINI